jgi:predicted patatin/cPLA2 family phospholipase
MQMTWQIRTRHAVRRDGGWKPCICIQGGGARGAWEAGVLAGLMASTMTAPPVAIWGTSAGALNALWATTFLETTNSNTLLDRWLAISAWVRCIAFAALFFGAGLFSLILISHKLMLTLVVLASCSIAGSALVLCGFWDRFPGLIPIGLVARLLTKPEGPARNYAYFCSADVARATPPAKWDWQSLGVFVVRPSSLKAEFSTDSTERQYDLRTAAMASAGLPVLCRPFRVGERLLLDGGLEANLPAEFIISNGMLGGHCAICIVPRPLTKLRPNEHVDFRVLRFLRDLKARQLISRNSASKDSSGPISSPAHTFSPVFVITPKDDLRSGLLTGFLYPRLLREEFELGQCVAYAVLEAMTLFISGNDAALDAFLLDNAVLEAVPSSVPQPGWWALWTHVKWLRRTDG